MQRGTIQQINHTVFILTSVNFLQSFVYSLSLRVKRNSDVIHLCEQLKVSTKKADQLELYEYRLLIKITLKFKSHSNTILFVIFVKR